MHGAVDTGGIGFKIRMVLGYLMIAILCVLPGIVLLALESWVDDHSGR